MPVKMTDRNDPSRQENGDQDQANDHVNDRLSPQLNGHVNGNDTHSDSDDENEQNNDLSGYEPIPQNENAPPDANRNENDENDTDDEPVETLDDILRRVHENQAENPSPHIQSMIVESQRQSDLEIVQERDSLFSQNSSASRNTIEMSSDRVDSIRLAMSSFTLPPSAIPSWARNLSEDDIQKYSNKLSMKALVG